MEQIEQTEQTGQNTSTSDKAERARKLADLISGMACDEDDGEWSIISKVYLPHGDYDRFYREDEAREIADMLREYADLIGKPNT